MPVDPSILEPLTEADRFLVNLRFGAQLGAVALGFWATFVLPVKALRWIGKGWG